QHGAVALPTSPKIDRDSPTTAAFVSGQQGSNGWYTGPVTVTLVATDIDGPADVSQITYSAAGAEAISTTIAPGGSTSFTINTDGITTITFLSADNAGNTEPAKTFTVRVDQTPPTITPLRTPAPNANGWNNTPVTVSFQCSDNVSGLAAGSPPTPTTLSSEGARQSV